ncbi:cystathionine gamma-lyase-like [Argiope bruennichi]|uniref:cystathionine gamma-lyase n=1 Tax=Argiope bruennichi TaxID=94029 RepID=A0A8T0FBQ9_ARGBR|nr:cystathionine gamma-lyase-like [Argiope bruennichi]KAF8787698.1 Cystathionine gamma-lyase like protein [Argiope bruennichi]
MMVVILKKELHNKYEPSTAWRRHRTSFPHNECIGCFPSPFDCYLCLRSLKTLHLRMQRHMENGLQVAQYLERHPKVEKVFYPDRS